MSGISTAALRSRRFDFHIHRNARPLPNRAGCLRPRNDLVSACTITLRSVQSAARLRIRFPLAIQSCSSSVPNPCPEFTIRHVHPKEDQPLSRPSKGNFARFDNSQNVKMIRRGSEDRQRWVCDNMISVAVQTKGANRRGGEGLAAIMT
jgi:hypothetical protein